VSTSPAAAPVPAAAAAPPPASGAGEAAGGTAAAPAAAAAAAAAPAAGKSSSATSTSAALVAGKDGGGQDGGAGAGAGSDDALLDSITRRQSVLMQPVVTLTLYVPTACVGAVIGRRGQAIAGVQRAAGQAATTGHPVRVSVLGGDGGGPLDASSLPYTYSDLDFADPNWTPVVIRADPRAAFVAAQRVEEILKANDSAMDDVVLDVPLNRQKHAAVVGKRGLVLANLSADTRVRVMVPNKDRRHDVVQLEGRLQDVKACLERVLVLAGKPASSSSAPPPAAAASSGGNNNSGAAAATGAAGAVTPAAGASSSSLEPGGEAAPPPSLSGPSSTQHSQTLVVEAVPSQTKIRGLSRKTDTVIKKKRAPDGGPAPDGGGGSGGGGGLWQLIVTGSTAEQVQSAIQLLQKACDGAAKAAAEASGNASGGGGGGTRGGGASGAASGAPAPAPRRGRVRSRGTGGGGGGGGKGSSAAAPKRGAAGGSGNSKSDPPPAPAPPASA
jgi:hypothetical protein